MSSVRSSRNHHAPTRPQLPGTPGEGRDLDLQGLPDPSQDHPQLTVDLAAGSEVLLQKDHQLAALAVGPGLVDVAADHVFLTLVQDRQSGAVASDDPVRGIDGDHAGGDRLQHRGGTFVGLDELVGCDGRPTNGCA